MLRQYWKVKLQPELELPDELLDVFGNQKPIGRQPSHLQLLELKLRQPLFKHSLCERLQLGI